MMRIEFDVSFSINPIFESKNCTFSTPKKTNNDIQHGYGRLDSLRGRFCCHVKTVPGSHMKVFTHFDPAAENHIERPATDSRANGYAMEEMESIISLSANEVLSEVMISFQRILKISDWNRG